MPAAVLFLASDLAGLYHRRSHPRRRRALHVNGIYLKTLGGIRNEKSSSYGNRRRYADRKRHSIAVRGPAEGRNGIGYITRFDPEEYKVKVAAEVKNFDPLQYIEKNQLRKMDLYTQYAVAAAAQAVEQSGLRRAIISTARASACISVPVSAA